MSYLRRASKNVGTPPQSQPLDEKQVPNSAGGYSYKVDVFKMLERFLVLGSEGGSYYASEQKLTFENIKSLEECLKRDGVRTVGLIVDISDKGRAVKNDPALFALAYCIANGDTRTRQVAEAALPRVARIGTHLFHFAEYAQAMRGWGTVLKRSVANWYAQMPVSRLGEQAIKYRQRDGWTHRDLLRLTHPKLDDASSVLANWICHEKASEGLPSKVRAHIRLQGVTDVKEAIALIREENLTWESVPTELLKSDKVWQALLERMPLTAMIRNLGRMTANGALKALSGETKHVCQQLRDASLLKKARVHPLNVLNALRTYQQGHGDKGKLSWTPVSQIAEALEDAFYLAFDAIESTGRNFYLGLDVSGSMSDQIAGMSISCREASVVMAMVTARKESSYYLRAFGHGMLELPVTAKSSLVDACHKTQALPWQGTDCALPMIDALKQKLEVDCFCVYTDSETWAGKVHPKQALDNYRQKMGRDARLVVVGMEPNKFSIADPNDLGMLDVVGFDTATPQLISQFAL